MADKTIPAIQNLRGNIGINIASPTKKLEVSSSGADVTTIKASYNSTNYLELAHNRINAVSSGGNDSILLQTAGTTRATINQAGLVTFAGTGSGALTIGSHIDLGDDQKVRLGGSDDLSIYHTATGNNSYIDNITGDLYIRNNSNDSVIIGHNANKGLMYVPDGRVELRFNDSKTFETIADGAKVTGSLGINTTPHTNQQLHIVASSSDTTGLEFSASHISNETRILSYDRGSGGGYRPLRLQSSHLKVEIGGVQKFAVDTSGNTIIQGDLTVNGTTTTLNSTTLQVDDKNIELGTVASPSDTTADGGGITLKGASDYTINWLNSNNSWNFNQGIVVGVDGTGYDVTFHSTTASRALQWDASAKALKLDDLTTFAVGSSDDLQFYHNTHSYIESKTNHLYINNNAADGKTVFKADDGGGSAQTEFFRIDGGGGTNVFSKPVHVGVDDTGHDVKFFGATSGRYLHWDESANALTGYYDLKIADNREIQIGQTNDLRLYHYSNNNWIKANSGDLIIQSDNDDLKLLAEDDIVLRDNDDSTNFIHCVNGGPVRLYHNGSQRLETTSSGVTISGLSLELFHSGGNNYISSAASGSHLLIRNTGGANVELLVNTSEKGVIAIPNGAVQLYHDNALKLTTTAGGADVSGTFGTGHINLDGELNFTTNGSKYIDVYTLANSNSFNIRHHNPSGNLYETAFQSVANGATTLYYDGGARLATTTDGISLHGNGYVDLPDNGRLRLGTNNDMMFYHYSSLSILDFQNHDGLIRNLTNDKSLLLSPSFFNNNFVATPDSNINSSDPPIYSSSLNQTIGDDSWDNAFLFVLVLLLFAKRARPSDDDKSHSRYSSRVSKV